jgi:hypothetical protein
MNFRYGSQPLSVTDVAGFVVSGEVPPESVVTCMAGFATLGRLSARSSPLVGSESAVTSMAGFAVRTQPGARTWMPGCRHSTSIIVTGRSVFLKTGFSDNDSALRRYVAGDGEAVAPGLAKCPSAWPCRQRGHAAG